MGRVIDGDQKEGTRFPAQASDDAFQQSMARLSLHLATRHSTVLLPGPKPLPSAQRWTGWPYLVVLVLAGAGAAAYHYSAFQGDLLGATTSTTAEARPAATGAVKAALPLMAAVPTAPAMPPASTTEESPVVKTALALPPPKATELQSPVETTTPDAELTWAEVLELQKRLASLGINAGPLDGIVGPRTMAGLQRYQELTGLAATGKADRQMLKLLQQDPGSSITLEARAQ